jgi:hypothetical protein
MLTGYENDFSGDSMRASIEFKFLTEQKRQSIARPLIEDLAKEPRPRPIPMVSNVNILEQLHQTGSSLPYINLRSVQPLVYKKNCPREKK